MPLITVDTNDLARFLEFVQKRSFNEGLLQGWVETEAEILALQEDLTAALDKVDAARELMDTVLDFAEDAIGDSVEDYLDGYEEGYQDAEYDRDINEIDDFFDELYEEDFRDAFSNRY